MSRNRMELQRRKDYEMKVHLGFFSRVDRVLKIKVIYEYLMYLYALGSPVFIIHLEFTIEVKVGRRVAVLGFRCNICDCVRRGSR